MSAMTVKKITQDSPNLKTYVFETTMRAQPGQFIMVWMPGVDEVPMSIGWKTATEMHVGIAAAGDCTQVIFDQIKVGDKLGIRGPYGTVFKYKNAEGQNYKKVAMIGGGYGTPPLLNLAQKTRAEGIDTTIILGGRTSEFLLYESFFEELGCRIEVATDDGSKGHKGYCTDVLEEILKEGGYDCLYTCGPELMMVKVAQMGQELDIDCQVSLERYMKCGFGICGQCCMDDSGIRICKDGPVIDGNYALEHPEFGKYGRSSSGKLEK